MSEDFGEQEFDIQLQKAIMDITNNHRKIIDDWCKAYMAEIYEKTGSLNPGDFILCEQIPTIHPLKNCLVRKYWFELKEKDDR